MMDVEVVAPVPEVPDLMSVEDEIQEDEMETAFEGIETNSTNNQANEYIKLLKDERVDEIALKIKEKCIYK